MNVSGTVWRVQYRHTNSDPAAPPEARMLAGMTLIVTADAAGKEVHAVAEFAVLGPEPAPGLGFTLTEVIRIGDVKGTANAAAKDAVH